MHTSKSSIHPETPEIVLRSVFKRYDKDNDGKLNINEFTNALEDLGIIDETEQKALFALADANNQKTIKYNDFVKLIKSNDFESILSSSKDYTFVIDTYTAFQQYDHNGDGQVTWSEFYFYLTSHGYSHDIISQYWYYMDENKKLTISFEQFWKGYKMQHAQQAIKAHQLQKQINEQIINDKHKKKKKKKKKYCQTFNRQSFLELVGNNSWDQNQKNNIFNYVLNHLSPAKQNISPYTVKTGRVMRKSECKIDININNKLQIMDTNSESEIVTATPVSQSQSTSQNGFNFVDYNIDDDNESICSSVSSPCTLPNLNGRYSTSLSLIASNSLEVTMRDSVAVVPVINMVENMDIKKSKKRNSKTKKYKNKSKNKSIKHKQSESNEY